MRRSNGVGKRVETATPSESRGGGLSLQPIPGDGSPAHAIYKYLLLSTRLDMAGSRLHVGLDGTLILEDLSAQIAERYFGERAESLVFGTAASGLLRQKIDNLCNRLGEGGGFTARPSVRARAGDGKLDVVAWKSFTDGLPGKLIGFGQCKTGTNYKDSLAALQPDAFARKWLISPPILPPVRMFFVSEALPTSPDKRHDLSVDAGLLFDRCRIVDYCQGVDPATMAKIREWTVAAAASNGLSRPQDAA